jgi:hypothetical protein
LHGYFGTLHLQLKGKIMTQYINKSALVAEIEECYIECLKKANTVTIGADYWDGKADSYHNVLEILSTIETKEAASIWNDARKTIPEDSSNQIICIKEDDLAVATIGKLVRGTKKWAYLNDLLNISDTQVKEADPVEEPDCIYNHTPNNSQITIGTKIRLKTNPHVILSIISNDCHEDEFECSNGSVLSLKQIEKYYDIII